MFECSLESRESGDREQEQEQASLRPQASLVMVGLPAGPIKHKLVQISSQFYIDTQERGREIRIVTSKLTSFKRLLSVKVPNILPFPVRFSV